MENKDICALLGDPQERDYQIWLRKQIELEQELDEMVDNCQPVFILEDGFILEGNAA